MEDLPKERGVEEIISHGAVASFYQLPRVVENKQEVKMGDFFLTVDLGTTSVKLIWWSEKGEKAGEDYSW